MTILQIDFANYLKNVIGCLVYKHPIITETKISISKSGKVNYQSLIIFAPNIDKQILMSTKKNLVELIENCGIFEDWIKPKKVVCKYGLNVIHYCKTYTKKIGYDEAGNVIKKRIKLPLLIVTT